MRSMTHTRPLTRIISWWLPLAVLFTLTSLMVCAALQLEMRQSANDPLVQMAEDAARALEGGKSASDVVPKMMVDMGKSLASYLIVYDDAGQPLVSSALLDASIPVPPPGVFGFTRTHGRDRITWQPQPGVRTAIVVQYVGGKQPGFVLAGRSLREIEERKAVLDNHLLVGWAASLVILFGVIAGLVLIEA